MNPTSDIVARYVARADEMSEGGKYEWWSGLSALISALVAERDDLADQLQDAQQPIWPKWAEDISKQLQTYGVEVDPFEGWDLPVDLDDWLSEAIRIETSKLETRAITAERLLAEAMERMTRLENTILRAHQRSNNWMHAVAIDALAIEEARATLSIGGGNG